MGVPKEIEEVFDAFINPRLAADRGCAEPIMFENGIVTIRMGGACRGCLAADHTLNHVILKELTERCSGLRIEKVVIDDSVSPELWEMAQKILKGEDI